MSKMNKPKISVRFYAEAQAQDSARFARPVKFENPPREGYIQQIPAVHEGMIKAVFPFQASDGTWGCAFRLDANGRIDLEVVSTERRGTMLVAFVATKSGTHQVAELYIDRPIRDGIIVIPKGLTELEIAALTKEFAPWTAPKKKGAKEPEPEPKKPESESPRRQQGAN